MYTCNYIAKHYRDGGWEQFTESHSGVPKTSAGTLLSPVEVLGANEPHNLILS